MPRLPAALLMLLGCGGRSAPHLHGAPDAASMDASVKDVATLEDESAAPDEGGASCATHEDCGPGLLCLSVETAEVCRLCEWDNLPCECGSNAAPHPYPVVACDRDADCRAQPECQCADCAPCAPCIHGWCAFPTGAVVECWCPQAGGCG